MSFKKNILIEISGLCICFLLFHSSFIFASDGDGRFFGISLGVSDLDFDDPDADRIDDRGTYVKLTGNYAINNNFAMEYGYLDYGSFSAQYPTADEKVTADGFALIVATVGNVLIAPDFRLLGKIGLDYWSEDVHANFNFGNSPQSASGHGSGISPFFGVGMQYDLSKDLLIRIELEKYQGTDVGVNLATNGLDSIDLSDTDVTLIGATFLFAF